MRDDNDDRPPVEPKAFYQCGKCGLRWRGERTLRPVGCPRCNNYSRIGVDPETARFFDDRRRPRA
jgi:DNA-directed RNA polymerase subunit RPC12/RpoP